MSGIYLRQGDAFIAMRETPYDAEAVLQELVADHPEMLVGEDSGHGALLLVRREVAVTDSESSSGRWSLDHLFVDAAGVPTLVEVKRSSDTRARREVVAQMLDYAANAAISWNVDQLQAWQEAECTRRGATLAQALSDAFGIGDPDAYWEAVRTNLAAERLRLVFVADTIAPELARIIEFLNGQMSRTEVLAIEVKQYVDEAGEQQTIVPRVVGQTESARAVKGHRPVPLDWNESSILAALTELSSPARADTVSALIAWARRHDDIRLAFGRGTTRQWGSLQFKLDGALEVSPFTVWTNGSLEVGFEGMAKTGWPPFDAEPARRELQSRLNALPGVAIPDERLAKRPNIALDDLAGSLPALQEIFDWTFAQARSVTGDRG